MSVHAKTWDKMLAANTALTVALLGYANSTAERIVRLETQMQELSRRVDAALRTQSPPRIGPAHAYCPTPRNVL